MINILYTTHDGRKLTIDFIFIFYRYYYCIFIFLYITYINIYCLYIIKCIKIQC